MGMKMAPQYANLFMDDLERKFMDTQPLKPVQYFRYIDDIYMAWTHGRDTLDNLLMYTAGTLGQFSTRNAHLWNTTDSAQSMQKYSPPMARSAVCSSDNLITRFMPQVQPKHLKGVLRVPKDLRDRGLNRM